MKTEIEKIQEEYKALGERIEALKNEKPKFEAGKWVKWMPDGTKGRIIGKCPTHEDSFQLDTDFSNTARNYNSCHISNLRLLTEQAVSSHLIAEAKKRGYNEFVVVKSLLFPGDTYEFNHCKPEYNASTDTLHMGGSAAYRKGKWAEIIEVKDQPILIGGL